MSALFFFLCLAFLSGQAKDDSTLSLDQRFSVAFSETKIELNPLYTYSATEAQIYTALYEGLLAYDPVTLKPQAGAATEWRISEDKKTYTFTLRSDAQFSDGTDLSAEIFKNTWLAVLNPETGCPFAGLLDPIEGAVEYRNKKGPASAVAIKALDAKTLEVRLKVPTSHFLQILCHQSLVPIHPSMLKTKVWKPGEVIGNGPYRISKIQPDALVLIKSDTYWDKAACQVTRIEMLFKDNPSGISDGFNSGEINWVESGADLEKVENPQAFQVSPQFSTTLLYFGHQSKVMDNPDLRRAFTMLMPMDKLRSRELFSVPSERLIPEIPFYPKADVFGQGSRKEALELLSKAGYPNGKGLKVRALFPESELFRDVGAIMQDGLNGTDLNLELSFIDSEEYYDLMTKGDFELASLSWVGDYADPMTFLDLYVSKSSLNQSAFADAEYDSLITQAQSLEGKERYKLLSKAESLLLAKAQIIPLAHSPSFNLISLEQVGGWYRNPLNIHPFKYLFMKSRKPPRNIAGL